MPPQVPPKLPPIPEIVVPGSRPPPPSIDQRRRFEPSPVRPGGFFPDFDFDPGFLAGAGFLAPALQPAIEEVIVTAPRPVPVPAASPSLLGRLATGTAGFFALIGGTLLAKITDEISQQRLEAEFAEMMAPDAFVPGDTPVLPMQPEVLPEIVVKARRPLPDFVLPPLPQFIEFGTDPAIMIPFLPRFLPDVAVPQIDTEIVTPTLPEIAPAPRPATIPRPVRAPTRSPQVAPLQNPLARPLADPLPAPQPFTAPSPSLQPFVSPLTSVQPTVRPSTRSRTRTRTRTRTQPQARPLTELQRRLCPPCTTTDKKKRKKKRTVCYKKLVKEHAFPSQDEEFNWVRIDCFTGRELS